MRTRLQIQKPNTNCMIIEFNVHYDFPYVIILRTLLSQTPTVVCSRASTQAMYAYAYMNIRTPSASFNGGPSSCSRNLFVASSTVDKLRAGVFESCPPRG